MTAHLRFLQVLMSSWLRGKAVEEAGASLYEYALLLALIVLVAFGALALFGHDVSNLLNNTDTAIRNA